MAFISDEKKAELLKIKKEMITVDMIVELFGYHMDPNNKHGAMLPPRYITSDRMKLNAHEYINQEAVSTNVGIFLFNKLLIEKTVEEFIPNHYFNEVVTKKSFQKIFTWLADAIKNGKLSLQVGTDDRMYNFLRDYEFWTLRLPAVFSPGYTMKMIVPDPDVMKKKEVLLKQKPKTIEDMTRVEDELVALARKKTDKDPGRSLFDSGSRGSFENDYKNMSIMVGAVQNPVTGGYDMMKSNYIDGISKEDLPAAGNVVVNSEYPKAIGTAHGGYITKQFYAAFQGITLGPKDSDCHTKEGLSILITEDNGASYIDQYIMERGKNVLLTPENISSYYGKTVKLRSPMFCINDDICNICMGERYYKIGIDAMGLTGTRMSNNLMQKNLKLRHNMKVSLTSIDPDHVLIASPEVIRMATEDDIDTEDDDDLNEQDDSEVEFDELEALADDQEDAWESEEDDYYD